MYTDKQEEYSGSILHLKLVLPTSIHPSVHELVQEILTKDRDHLARFDAKYNYCIIAAWNYNF